MALVRARSPVVWIRRLLLIVGLAGVMTLGLMLVAYKFGRSGLEGADDPPAAARTDESTVTSGQGFAFVHTIDGRPVFNIQAETNLRDRQDTTYLETVVLDIYREDGETYQVTSNNARVNETTWDAHLEGDVVVSGWGDLQLEARAFDLQHSGQVLVSRGAVQFRYPPDLEGRATSLRIDRRSDTINLSGGVHIRSTPSAATPMRLDCERLVYKRGEGLMRALDDVYLRQGEQELSTRALTIFLLEDGKSLKMLRARFGVSGTARTPSDYGGETRIDFRGELLELEPVADEPTSRKVRIVGSDDQVASLSVVDPEGLGRTLSAQHLESAMTDGRPVYVEGRGDPLIIDEFLDMETPFPLRQVCALQASARFLADGSLSQIFLEKGVELWNGDFHLSGGSQARLELESGKVEIEGPMVELYSERGDLAAPRITYVKDTGLIRAVSGVRASLESSAAAALGQTPFGQGQGPIRVESEEAFWTSDPPAFTFLGGVRAWRDQNLLLADQLRGDQETQEMSASGGVRTVWFSEPRTNGGTAASAPRSIEVTSDFLTYRQAESTVVYSGKVKVHQEQRRLSCRDLQVELTEGGQEAKRMTCRNNVRLVDLNPQNERRVFGDEAIYTLVEDQVEVYGDVVKLFDSQNNQLEGKYLRYDLGAGLVEIRSKKPQPGSELR